MSFPVNNIREVCKERKTTLAEVERKLKIGNGVIARWEKSKNYPPYDRIIDIANLLEVPVERLTGEKEKPAAQGDGLSTFDSAVLDFMHSLPREQLRGILLALKAPQELLDALDHEEHPE